MYTYTYTHIKLCVFQSILKHTSYAYTIHNIMHYTAENMWCTQNSIRLGINSNSYSVWASAGMIGQDSIWVSYSVHESAGMMKSGDVIPLLWLVRIRDSNYKKEMCSIVKHRNIAHEDDAALRDHCPWPCRLSYYQLNNLHTKTYTRTSWYRLIELSRHGAGDTCPTSSERGAPGVC